MNIKVVIRQGFLDRFWWICHAKSYQNAFRSKVNGYKTRNEAVNFAEQNGCTVVEDIIKNES